VIDLAIRDPGSLSQPDGCVAHQAMPHEWQSVVVLSAAAPTTVKARARIFVPDCHDLK
jgi:hypothetical protein